MPSPLVTGRRPDAIAARAARAMAGRVAATATLAAALGVSTGCYSYATVPSPAARPGSEVLVTLAEPGAGDLARFLGPRAATLEGRVLTASDTALSLSVATIVRTTGVAETWPGDAVVLPRAAIATVQTREFAGVRSGLVVAGVVALGALVAAAFRTSDDVGRGGRTPGGSGRQ